MSESFEEWCKRVNKSGSITGFMLASDVMSHKGVLNQIWHDSQKGLLDKINTLEQEKQELVKRVKKLEQLILLTDESVSNITVSDTQLRQWAEYMKCLSTFQDNGLNI